MSVSTSSQNSSESSQFRSCPHSKAFNNGTFSTGNSETVGHVKFITLSLIKLFEPLVVNPSSGIHGDVNQRVMVCAQALQNIFACSQQARATAFQGLFSLRPTRLCHGARAHECCNFIREYTLRHCV